MSFVTMAPPEQLTDEELLRRMAGHLKPILAPHILHGTRPKLRYAMAIFWFALFLGTLCFLWATILYPVHYLITWGLFSLARAFDIFGMLFGPGFMEVNGPVNNLIYTLEIVGTYLFTAWWLTSRAARTHDSAKAGLLTMPLATSRLSLRGYYGLFLSLFTYLPYMGLTCLGLNAAPEGSRGAVDHDQLLVSACACLVIVQSDTPLSMEMIWKLVSARFPAALPGPEQQDKILLLPILRDLTETSLAEEQGIELGKTSACTEYRATDTLKVLFSRCRGLGSRIDAPTGSKPRRPAPRPEPPPDIARPEPPPDVAQPAPPAPDHRDT